MIIKNSNQATDVQKDSNVSWEGKKDSKRFYVKKTISYGVWSFGVEPTTVPNISWEGGTTETFKFYRQRTNSIREGFSSWTEEQKEYYDDATLYNANLPSDCKINISGYNISFTFGKHDDTSSDRVFTICAKTSTETIFDAYIKVTQAKRDRYVTKLDNAVIIVDNIPASGGNVSKGTLTYTKTYNTGETEQGSEEVTFSNVSATTKGTTESDVTDVKTIAAGGTNQKSTTIDGVTLTHPAFTVKQGANVKIKSTTTTEVILTASTNVIYVSGTVTFTTQRKYTLTYTYTSGSKLEKQNQGPENIITNGNIYVYKDDKEIGNTGRQMSYNIQSDSTTHIYKFNVTYDNIKSNDVTVNYELDGPNPSTSKYSNLQIVGSYPKNYDGCHVSAAGGIVYSKDVDFTISFTWTYTKYSGTSESKTLTYTKSQLNTSEYLYDSQKLEIDSFGTTQKDAQDECNYFFITVSNPKNKECNNQDTNLETTTRFSLSQQGNKIESSTIKSSPTTTTAEPNELEYTGGTVKLTVKGKHIYENTWTSTATSTSESDIEDISLDCDFYIYNSTDKKTWKLANDEDMFTKPQWTLSAIGKITQYWKFHAIPRTSYEMSECIVTQEGNSIKYTVTFHINNTYAKWYNGSSELSSSTVTKKFEYETPYTQLIPDETPKWIDGSDMKYEFQNNYSTSTSGSAVTSSSLLTTNISLFARWSTPSNGAYIKVTWDPNGGTLKASSGSNTTTSSVYNYYKSGSVSVKLTDIGWNNTPTKTSNSFVGWVDTDGAHTMPYTFNLTSAHKFTANFTTTSKTIIWNSNGGEWSSSPTTERETTANYGSSISSYTPTPSKSSTNAYTYSFSGWSLTTSGSTVSFPYTITTLNNTFNFYAKYSATTRYYTVTWFNTYKDSSLAVFSDGTYADKTTSVAYNTSYSSLTPPDTNSQVSFGGTTNSPNTVYQIAVWYDNNDFANKITSSSKKVTGNCTIYLKYTYVKHKLTLNSNGASFKNNSSTTTTTTYTALIDANSSTIISGYSITDIPAGKEFIGWSTNASATFAEVLSSSFATAFTISAPTTYYAIFTTGVYTVTWNNTDTSIAIWNDGTKTSKTSSESYGTVYKSLMAPASLRSPIHNDADTIRYTGAWYTASSGGTLLSSSSSTVTGNTNVYLQLTVASYKVTLNPNSGTLTVGSSSYTSSSLYVTYVKTLNLGSYTPIKSGYNFKGWAETSSATSGSTSSVTITSTKTYYAVWKYVFTVTWNLNGGTYNSSTTNPTQSVESGSTVSFSTYTPTKSDYTFQGWATSTSATSGSTSGNSSAIIANTTFYAIWKSAALTPILLILAS